MLLVWNGSIWSCSLVECSTCTCTDYMKLFKIVLLTQSLIVDLHTNWWIHTLCWMLHDTHTHTCICWSNTLLHSLHHERVGECDDVLCSVNVKFQQFHSNVFIAWFLITTHAHFDVISDGCVECSVKPRHVWWVTAGIISGAAYTVPEAVFRVPFVTPWLIQPIAVVVIFYKGWWLWSEASWLTET